MSYDVWADTSYISIHALLAESDGEINTRGSKKMSRFLSTLSLRRATSMTPSMGAILILFLSTLSLRRATNDAINGCNPDFISIHALLAESDCLFCVKLLSQLIFLSTLSLRRATLTIMLYDTSSLTFLSTLSLRRATMEVYHGVQ